MMIKNCLFFFFEKKVTYITKMTAKVENFSLLASFVSDFQKYHRLPSNRPKIKKIWMYNHLSGSLWLYRKKQEEKNHHNMTFLMLKAANLGLVGSY